MEEPFTDVDFADDVVLLAEMLSVLVLALEVMNTEAQPLGMSITGVRQRFRTWVAVVLHANVSVFKGTKWRP